MKLILLFLCAFVNPDSSLTALPVKVDTCQYCCPLSSSRINGSCGQECNADFINITLIRYRIENDTEHTCYTWIDYARPYYASEGLRPKEIVNRYFFSRHGDFNFGTILWENTIGFNRHYVGFFFIKELRPGQSFEYQTITENDAAVPDLRKYIVVIDNVLFNYIKISKEQSFTGNSIVIPFGFEF